MGRQYKPFKIYPERLSVLLERILQSKTNRAEWTVTTSLSYIAASGHFITWYRDNFNDFDDTPGIVRGWKDYITHQGSNQTSYRAVSNIALCIYDTMDALQQDVE